MAELRLDAVRMLGLRSPVTSVLVNGVPASAEDWSYAAGGLTISSLGLDPTHNMEIQLLLDVEIIVV